MNDPAIFFSHRYKKMPALVEHCETFIKSIEQVHYNDLTAEEIEKDTAITTGGNYTLPHMQLIRITLWTATIHGGKEWATLRPWTKDKEAYYRGLLGQQIKIVLP